MNVRDLQRYLRLRRIVVFLLEHVELREAVDRSGVIPILQTFIAEIERLDQGGTAARLEGIGLTAQRNTLRRVLWDKLDAIGCAADIARVNNAAIPPLHPPPFGKRAAHLTSDARGILSAAVQHRADLQRAGLLPTLIDEIAPLAELIDSVESGRIGRSNKRKGRTSTIPMLIRSSSGTVKLVRRQFEPLMSPDTRAEWDAVLSLGRTHRPKTLGDGQKPALGDGGTPRTLPRASARLLPPSQRPAGAPKRGIIQRLVDFMRPSAAKQPVADARAPAEDVQVEEIKRLPASTDAASAAEGSA